MNARNTISINQEIHLKGFSLAPADAVITALGQVHDNLLPKLNALAAVNEILAECQSTSLDAGKLFFLLNGIEENFNDLAAYIEDLMQQHRC